MGNEAMRSEAERQDKRKAMAFDLCKIIDEDPSQETYTKRLYRCSLPQKNRSESKKAQRFRAGPFLVGQQLPVGEQSPVVDGTAVGLLF